MKIPFETSIKIIKPKQKLEFRPGDEINIYESQEAAHKAVYDIMMEKGIDNIGEFYALEDYYPVKIDWKEYDFVGFEEKDGSLGPWRRFFLYERYL